MRLKFLQQHMRGAIMLASVHHTPLLSVSDESRAAAAAASISFLLLLARAMRFFSRP